MSVREMRQMLGLGKTDSYWLCHQGFFETILVNGKMRVVIDSFEEWYAMQTKHRKVTGEMPGSRLHEETLSAKEISQLLGISTQQANILIRQAQFPFIKVHSRFHVSKEAFDRWYDSQDHYIRQQERTAALNGNWLSVSQIAERLGVNRSTAYSIVISKRRQSILNTIRLGDRSYVKATDFECWLNSQSKYKPVPERSRRKKAQKINKPHLQLRKPKNPNYYTVEEICRFYSMRHAELYEKLQSGDIPALKTGKTWRIKKSEFDEILTGRSNE